MADDDESYAGREYKKKDKAFKWSLAICAYGIFCYLPLSHGLHALVILNRNGAGLATMGGAFASIGFYFERRRAQREYMIYREAERRVKATVSSDTMNQNPEGWR